ncbi:MAG: ribosomal protein S18-alanine N-acetyltransferase [Cyanobacteria bacterium P01_D01_bin.71]
MFVTCRPVNHSDLPDVINLDHRCFGGLWNESAYSREVSSPNSDLLVIEDNSANSSSIVGLGCLWAILEEAHITVLGIDPRHRRLGLGRWLLIHLLQAAIARDLTHATLEVRASNQVARSLYTSLGFQIAGERRRYYADDENALILWKNNLQAPVFWQTLTNQRQRLETQLRITASGAPQSLPAKKLP